MSSLDYLLQRNHDWSGPIDVAAIEQLPVLYADALAGINADMREDSR